MASLVSGEQYPLGTAPEARRKDSNSSAVTLSDGREETSRKLLLATEVADELPAIPNIEAFLGTSVFPCPYCDGWELRDEAVDTAALGAHSKWHGQ